jgi:glycerol-3-phosphate acyltransferase PlsY
MALLFRFSSLAGLAAALAMPVAAYFMQKEGLIWLFCVTLVLVAWKHRSNIVRLMAERSPKLARVEPFAEGQ